MLLLAARAGQGLWSKNRRLLGRTALDAPCRLRPAVLLEEDLVGLRELELGLAVTARKQSLLVLPLCTAGAAADRLYHVVLQKELGLRLGQEEHLLAVAAVNLLASLLLSHGLLDLGLRVRLVQLLVELNKILADLVHIRTLNVQRGLHRRDLLLQSERHFDSVLA